MSKKTSKRKASIKSSVLVLLLIAILLIVSTYAWFTANRTVTISSLDVQVQASNGLQISTDAINWKATISNTDITQGYTGHTNQIPTEMQPVSTTGVVADGTMNMFLGTIIADQDGDYALTSKKEVDTAGAKGNYITFDVFLKADTAMNITLTQNSNVRYTGLEDKGLQNAARVAFIDEGNVVATNPSGALALKGGTSFGAANPKTVIWEPNADSHTAEAATSANSTYFAGQDTVKSGTENAPIAYYGNKAAIDNDNAQKLSTVNTTGASVDYFAKMEGTTLKTTNAATNEVKDILHLEAGITKLRIYMWVEGQDVDCDNSASGTDIQFNIQFEAPAV